MEGVFTQQFVFIQTVYIGSHLQWQEEYLMSRCCKSNFFSLTPLPLSHLKVCGETVVLSYFSMLHPTFFTLTNLWAGLNTSTVKWSKLMKAKWRLGCYVRCPKGNWQIKWFVMVEEMDNALWEKLNHEENWNNSEERFGLLLTTHVCCSQLSCSSAEWGRFMVCYWSTISSLGEMEWLQSGSLSWLWMDECSHYHAVIVFDWSSCVWLPWILLLGCQRELDCFYCLHGWLRKSIGYWDLFLNTTCSRVYSHTNHTTGGKLHLAGVATGL